MFKAFGTEYDGGISSMLLHFGQSSLGIKKNVSNEDDKDRTAAKTEETKEKKTKWSLKDMLLQGFK